jgi:hypothetical protein
MHIGIDISLLRIAQAGVLTYHRALLNHLVRVQDATVISR